MNKPDGIERAAGTTVAAMIVVSVVGLVGSAIYDGDWLLATVLIVPIIPLLLGVIGYLRNR